MIYNTAQGCVKGRLNVHLVAHTQDDAGTLKTLIILCYFMRIRFKLVHILSPSNMSMGVSCFPLLGVLMSMLFLLLMHFFSGYNATVLTYGLVILCSFLLLDNFLAQSVL